MLEDEELYTYTYRPANNSQCSVTSPTAKLNTKASYFKHVSRTILLTVFTAVSRWVVLLQGPCAPRDAFVPVADVIWLQWRNHGNRQLCGPFRAIQSPPGFALLTGHGARRTWHIEVALWSALLTPTATWLHLPRTLVSTYNAYFP